MWDPIFLLMYFFNSKKKSSPPYYMGTILVYDKNGPYFIKILIIHVRNKGWKLHHIDMNVTFCLTSS
jgi:hypothetical protein